MKGNASQYEICMSINLYLYVIDMPHQQANLFIFSVGEILSKQLTTQCDPTSMGAYALGILPVLHSLFDFV